MQEILDIQKNFFPYTKCHMATEAQSQATYPFLPFPLPDFSASLTNLDNGKIYICLIENLGLDGVFAMISFQCFILKMMIKAEAHAIATHLNVPW